MSNENTINFKGIGNDAEGHAIRGKGGLDDGSGDDAECHGKRPPGLTDDDDAEGHAAKFKG